MSRVIKRIDEMKTVSNLVKRGGHTISFIPTMGYLHEGHLSLVKKGLELASYTVVSIFVNPTQFGPGEDFKEYPRDFERDYKLLDELGVDCIFYPDAKEMYPPDFKTVVKVEGLSDILCGVSRPTHFQGVTTVVLKLFNIVNPDYAVFGLKDYQQYIIIKRMVEDLNLSVQIIGSEIVREPDGLAMSSRNIYLTPKERKQALTLYQSLMWAKEIIEKEREKTSVSRIKEEILKRIKQSGGKPDYVFVGDAATLKELSEFPKDGEIVIALAAYYGKARLIDNVIIKLN